MSCSASPSISSWLLGTVVPNKRRSSVSSTISVSYTHLVDEETPSGEPPRRQDVHPAPPKRPVPETEEDEEEERKPDTAAKKKKILIFSACGAAVLIIALVLIFSFVLRQAKSNLIPSLTGYTLEEAQDKVSGLKITVEVERQEYSDEYDAGKITGQDLSLIHS